MELPAPPATQAQPAAILEAQASLIPPPLTNLPNLSDSALNIVHGPCPRCGAPPPPSVEAQDRIAELEAQVSMLTSKATTAADKLADCEEELRSLKATPADSNTTQQSSDGSSIPPADARPTPAQRSNTAPLPDQPAPKELPPIPAAGETATLHHRPSVRNRFAFLTRSNSHSPATAAAAARAAAAAQKGPTEREHELASALSQERTLREAAEGKIVQMNGEIEDLSSTLFQQANEMVADERKARAALETRAAAFEERCAALEDKVQFLESRDTEKRKRLERLEDAVSRIDRVRRVLDIGPKAIAVS